MTAQTGTAPFVERRKPPEGRQPTDFGWALFLIIVTVLMVAGYFAATDELFKAGDDIGYNLGLVGSLMMLTLLLYPVRKRVGFMRNWIILPKWFKWHMVVGVLGPMLIMFHSTFTIRSINAGVALVSMMLVSGSGIFGRFFYTRIHHGLYGRQATHQQLQAMLDGGEGAVNSILGFAPVIQQRMNDYYDHAMEHYRTGGLHIVSSIIIEIRSLVLNAILGRELRRVMYTGAHMRNLSRPQRKRLDEMYEQNKRFIHSYIMTIRDIAQFSTYERLFSLWYLFHVPLVYLLVFSGIWHVYSVHKY